MQPAAVHFAFVCALLTTSAVLIAQPPVSDLQPVSAPPQKLISFDVASVRLQAGDGGGPIHFTANGFVADPGTLEYLIRNAYGITRDNSVRGLPAWGVSDRYVVSAKVADSDLVEWKTYNITQRRLVLQKFLAERFRLTLHPETIEVPIYSLIVAKGGPKLQQVTPQENDPHGFMEPKGPGIEVGHHVTIAYLAGELSRSNFGLDRQVYDHTGLAGNYDFTLTFEPLRSADTGAESGPSGRPSIFTALQEQLGLKLEPIKGPVDTVVVDHAERPSEN
jgi:uncharacterized protein (TIGR03435 family)